MKPHDALGTLMPLFSNILSVTDDMTPGQQHEVQRLKQEPE